MKPIVLPNAAQSFEDAFAALSRKQQLYVQSRLSGMGPTAACMAAGIEGTSLESVPTVRNAMHLARKQLAQKVMVDKNDVINGMLEAVDASATATEMVTAWREVGRLIGAYEPEKVEVIHNVEQLTLDQIHNLSSTELARFAMQQNAQLPDALSAEYEVLGEALRPPEPVR